MEFTLPDLPYEQGALAPVISKKTMHHHYEKHHAGYVKKLEAALPDADRGETLEDIIVNSYRQENSAVFNPAAQIWNHTFYWHSMTPDPVGVEDKRLQSLIEKSFGNTDKLLREFKDAAVSEFGSGWAWLLYDRGSDLLQIRSTTDAVNPLPMKLTPLLTMDVWEHAYYLDYQQDRGKYVDGFLDKLINWRFAAENLKQS